MIAVVLGVLGVLVVGVGLVALRTLMVVGVGLYQNWRERE